MILMVFRGLFLLLLGIALYAGLKAQPVPQVVSNFDLMLHFGAFATLSALWLFGFAGNWWLPGLIFLVCIGAGIELLQGWMLPGRVASLVDMSANAAGVFLGAIFAYATLYIFRAVLPDSIGH